MLAIQYLCRGASLVEEGNLAILHVRIATDWHQLEGGDSSRS